METIIRRATTGAMAVAVALGLALGAVAFTPDGADAMIRRPGLGHEGAKCTYADKEYSEGSVIKHGDGKTYRCSEGAWYAASIIAPETGFSYPQITYAGQLMTYR